MSTCFCFFFFKQKTAYEMRISDWSSDVCSSDLADDQSGRAVVAAAIIFAVAPAIDAVVVRQAALAVTAVVAVIIIGIIAVVARVGPVPEIGRASCRERVCQYV